jgi:hypothetical protein
LKVENLYEWYENENTTLKGERLNSSIKTTKILINEKALASPLIHLVSNCT